MADFSTTPVALEVGVVYRMASVVRRRRVPTAPEVKQAVVGLVQCALRPSPRRVLTCRLRIAKQLGSGHLTRLLRRRRRRALLRGVTVYEYPRCTTFV